MRVCLFKGTLRMNTISRIGRFSANGTILSASLLNDGGWFFVLNVAPPVAGLNFVFLARSSLTISRRLPSWDALLYSAGIWPVIKNFPVTQRVSEAEERLKPVKHRASLTRQVTLC